MSDDPELHGDHSQGDQAYERLLDDIAAGRLQPGDRLREVELAQRLGASRTPIREALRLLEADNLITHAPRLGATVRRLNYAEIAELYEMRAVMEGAAARLAARVVAPIELEELAALNAELASAQEAGDAKRLNAQFHAMLLNAARNRFLSRAMESLGKALMILGPTTLDAERRAEAAREHDALLDALRDRDGARAEAVMRAHIEASQKIRLRSLRAP